MKLYLNFVLKGITGYSVLYGRHGLTKSVERYGDYKKWI